jgi:GrpB-like predicted nucleotidyltransferase (UPF0157 family)
MRVEFCPPDGAWPEQFATHAAALRRTLGTRALRIDHIGSTSIPDLAAKPIIDIQVSVESLEPFGPLHEALASLGYTFMADNDDVRKLFFYLNDPTSRLVNLHVRRLGEFSQQVALLFRDYLRVEPSARRRYERVKQELAERDWDSIEDYANAKGDVVWALIREADIWSWAGWEVGPSDA